MTENNRYENNINNFLISFNNGYPSNWISSDGNYINLDASEFKTIAFSCNKSLGLGIEVTFKDGTTITAWDKKPMACKAISKDNRFPNPLKIMDYLLKKFVNYVS